MSQAATISPEEFTVAGAGSAQRQEFAERLVLGLVTIGQSPRTDITADMADVLDDVDVIEHGVLDDIDVIEGEFLPGPHDSPLVTLMRDGRSVRVRREAVHARLDSTIDACVRDGADVVLVMCTGHLHVGAHPVPVLTAEAALSLWSATQPEHAVVGVITPSERQRGTALERWTASPGPRIVMSHADPYAPDAARLAAQASRDLVTQQAGVVVLDCMGFGAEHRRAVQQAIPELTVMVARELALREALTLARAVRAPAEDR